MQDDFGFDEGDDEINGEEYVELPKFLPEGAGSFSEICNSLALEHSIENVNVFLGYGEDDIKGDNGEPVNFYQRYTSNQLRLLSWHEIQAIGVTKDDLDTAILGLFTLNHGEESIEICKRLQRLSQLLTNLKQD